MVFRVVDKEFPNKVLTASFKHLSQDVLNAYISEYQPDVIIAVFPLWASILENYTQVYGKTFSV